MIDITAIEAVRSAAPDTSRTASRQDAAGFLESLESLRRAEPPKTGHPSRKAEAGDARGALVEKQAAARATDKTAGKTAAGSAPDKADPAPEEAAPAPEQAAEAATPETDEADAGPDIPLGSGAGDLVSLFLSLHISPPPANAVVATPEEMPAGAIDAPPLELGAIDAGAGLIVADTPDIAADGTVAGQAGTAAMAAGVLPSMTAAPNTVAAPQESVIETAPIAAIPPAATPAQPDPADTTDAAVLPAKSGGDIDPDAKREKTIAIEGESLERERAASEPDRAEGSAATRTEPATGAPDGARPMEAPRDVRPPAQAAQQTPQPAHIVVRQGAYDNLGLHVVRSSREGEDRTVVRLDPPRLGNVELTLETRGEVTRVVLVAERPEALELLRRDAQSLEQSLTRAGLKMDGGMEFSLRQDPRGSNGGGRDDARREQSPTMHSDEEQELLASPPAHSARSGLEMIV